ncbi:hypothetical protein [Roseateles asaccharophilus]|uniref:Autotransporter domain-containing protein n=1 Tax=Roseateles asaccharophilus TaxID=582607 RepID=A0ABU2ADI5_9BURK|nr:hypothetical protein [Roseateles asaccharophilus]MDR7335271.1 hypothetical protein [Roseateles asaccharophilus]
MHSVQPLVVAAALLLGSHADAEEAAPNADKRAINTAVQRDARGNQSAAAAVGLPVGSQAWVQAGVGRSRSRDAASGATYKPSQVAAGGGVAGRSWQASLNASQRRDGGKLRQMDWGASADWKPVDGVVVGVDATRRSARARGTAAGAAVEQRLKGQGAGVHAAVAVTPRLSVYGATMRNKYKSSTTQQTTTTPPGLLGALTGNRVSVVNRDEAALDRSHQLGATWRISERVALNGEVTQDRVFEGGRLQSVQLKAAIAAGISGWTFTPGIGRSRDAQGASVNSGSLAASFAW